MKLIIAEKEAVAVAIAKYFEHINKKIKKNPGYIEVEDFIIAWLSGHLLELKSPEQYDINLKKWSLDVLPIFFTNWESIPLENSKASFLLNTLKKFLRDENITEIYHCGDPDDEGQYLVDEVLNYFNNRKPVKRLLINDTTVGGIEKAFKNIKDNQDFLSIGKSAYARAVADYMIGINFSRFFTLYLTENKKTLSVGRVQTPTLAMVVNRDFKVENHIKEKYYELYLSLELIKSSNENEKLALQTTKKLYQDNFHNKELGNKYFNQMIDYFERLQENYTCSLKYVLPKHRLKEFPKGKITSREIFEELQKLIEITKLTTKVEKKIKKENPPLPFNLSRLQYVADKKYNYSPDEVLKITQELRDNYNAITYNRSDCEYLSTEQYLEAPNTIPIVLDNLNIDVPEIQYDIKSLAFNDENITAHTGIIPTNEKLDLSSFSEKQRNIYKLICDYYIIQFLSPCLIEQTTISLDVFEEKDFKRTANKIIEAGYKNYLRDKANDDEFKKDDITSLIEGNYKSKIISTNIEEKETTPPKYYTQGEIIKDMCSISKYVDDEEIKRILKEKDKNNKGANGSIGTPATQSSIIKTLLDRGFLEQKGKNVISTKLGRELINILPLSITTPNLTALWWLKQEAIKSNETTIDEFLEAVLSDIKSIISQKYEKINIVSEKESLGECPMCKEGQIHEKKSKEGKVYYSCSNKECKFFLWEDSKHFNNPIKITKAKLKNMLNGKKQAFKMVNKQGKEYEGYLNIKINGNFVNFELDGFKNNSKKK